LSAIILLILTFVIFGFVHADRRALPSLDQDHIVHHVTAPQQVVIVGTLAKTVTKGGSSCRAQIDVSFIRTDIDGPLKPAEGRTLLSLKGAWPTDIRPGDSLTARAVLDFPAVVNTPGTFNYREYLARRSIYLTGFVTHPALIRHTEKIDRPLSRRVLYRIERLRADIGSFLDSRLPARSSGIYKALLIGDRSDIVPEDLETFKRAGIMHLLAISGMHVGMIAAMLYYLINWLLKRSTYLILRINVRKAALLLLFPLLFFYTLLTGANPPVVRSLIMLTAFILSFSLDRYHPPLIPLTCSAFVILLFDPLAAFSPSFQLSFAAVASIIVFTPKLLNRFDAAIGEWSAGMASIRIIRFIVAVAIVTSVATIGTLPLMLLQFNRVSLVVLPANVMIQPLVCFCSLPLGLTAILCSPLAGNFADVLLQAGATIIDASLAVAELFSAHEGTQLWLPDPPIWACLLYYLALLLAGFAPLRRLTGFASLTMLAGSLVMILQIQPYGYFHHPYGWTVSILDVGHGSAAVIEMSSGRIILIDGGAKSTPEYDCGERIIAPYLWKRNIGRVNDIVITHDDADHYSGIDTIIRRFRPARIFIPSIDSAKKGMRQIIGRAQQHGVELIVPENDMTIGGEGEKLRIFLAESGGYKADTAPQSPSEDDRGLVLKFVSDGVSVLFPGDITGRKETELAERLDVESTVLLSPHHGSSSSNSRLFLSKVNPQLLIFSANDHGKGLFPSALALRHAKSLGIKTHTTSVDGTVMITYTHPGGYRLETFSRSAQRFYREG
jgi:competence protein ComEC